MKFIEETSKIYILNKKITFFWNFVREDEISLGIFSFNKQNTIF